MDWQSIETAPLDGTVIYVVRHVADWPGSLFHVSAAGWFNGMWWCEDRNEVDEPTHWCSIKEPA